MKAEHYKVPIDSFLEKASLSKPIPSSRAVTQKKLKDIAKIPVAVLAQGKRPETNVITTTSLSVASAPRTEENSSWKSYVPDNDIIEESSVVDNPTIRKPSPRQSQEIISEKGIEGTKSVKHAATKRRSSAKPSDSPQPKRRKTSKSVSTEFRNDGVSEAIAAGFQEIENHFISLMRKNQGVFELVPRMDLEYAAHVERFFPEAQRRVDGKLLTHILDTLEARGEVVRVMLSTVTSIGTKQYKSVLTLPEIDPMTDRKISHLREELQREGGSYRPALINSEVPEEPAASKTASTTIEIVQNLPKPARIPPLPIPAAKQLPAIPKAIIGDSPKTTSIPFVPIPPPSMPAPAKVTKKQSGRGAKLVLESPPQRQPSQHTSDQYESMDEGDADAEPKFRDEGCLRLFDGSNYVDDTLAKRRRVIFQPEEDRTIYQAVSLVKKYVRLPGIPWAMLKPIIPDRKGTSIKKRYEYLLLKMKRQITRFLDVFERRYSDAQQRGEVKPIESGMLFDLEYCLNWYNNGGFEAEEEQQQELPRYDYYKL